MGPGAVLLKVPPESPAGYWGPAGGGSRANCPPVEGGLGAGGAATISGKIILGTVKEARDAAPVAKSPKRWDQFGVSSGVA